MITGFRNRLYKSSVYTVVLLVQAVFFNCAVYLGGRMIAGKLPHYCFASRIDALFPLLPWTVLIYWGGALFWARNYYLGAKNKINGHSQMIMAHVIGEAVCFLAFVLLPSTMSRPEITGTALSDQLLRLTYRLDRPDNLFPSIHCFVSWLCWIEVRRNPRIPVWYQLLSFFASSAICFSTLTVKQHVLVDVAAGILLAEGSYSLAGRIIKRREQ